MIMVTALSQQRHHSVFLSVRTVSVALLVECVGGVAISGDSSVFDFPHAGSIG